MRAVDGSWNKGAGDLPNGPNGSNGTLGVLIYNANFNAWVHYLGNGINCGMPPEAFLQLNAELGTNPWITGQMHALDPLTDYHVQYAIYARDNYPSMHTYWEITNETWLVSAAAWGPAVPLSSLPQATATSASARAPATAERRRDLVFTRWFSSAGWNVARTVGTGPFRRGISG